MRQLGLVARSEACAQNSQIIDNNPPVTSPGHYEECALMTLVVGYIITHTKTSQSVDITPQLHTITVDHKGECPNWNVISCACGRSNLSLQVPQPWHPCVPSLHPTLLFLPCLRLCHCYPQQVLVVPKGGVIGGPAPSYLNCRQEGGLAMGQGLGQLCRGGRGRVGGAVWECCVGGK